MRFRPWNFSHSSMRFYPLKFMSGYWNSSIEIHEWYLMDIHLQFLGCRIFFWSTLFHCQISWNFYSLSIHSSIKFYPPQLFWMKFHPLEFKYTLNDPLHAQVFFVNSTPWTELFSFWNIMKVHLMDSFYIRKKIHPIGSFCIHQNSCHCTWT